MRKPARKKPLARSATLGLTMALTAGGLGAGGTAYATPPSVDQEMPFPCGEVWTGSTRSSHSPGFWSIDFNRDGDLGRPVVASAPGHVYRVNDVGDTSYGKYVFIDHGNGESTVYAHLSKFLVQEGAYVDQGEMIGLLGNSGGSYGAHLHYEQRYGSSVGQPFFHQYPFVFDLKMTSQNCANAPLTGDWDGDGDSERAVFVRGRSKGAFKLRIAPRRVKRLTLGSGVEQVASGDWDGDGVDGVAVRDPRSRAVMLRGADGSDEGRVLAPLRVQIVAGDFDGDGRDSIALYRPKRHVYLIRNADGTKQRIRWGTEGSLPLAGDWDGDGLDDVGSFEPAAAEFSLRIIDAETGAPLDVRVPVTGPTDKDVVEDPLTDPDEGQVPVVEPTDPDAEPAPDPTVTDPGADPAEPETADPTVEQTEPAEPPSSFELFVEESVSSTPLPVIGDWNGDGRSDLGLWDPKTAQWTSWVVNSLERRAAAARSNKFGRPRY